MLLGIIESVDNDLSSAEGAVQKAYHQRHHFRIRREVKDYQSSPSTEQ